MDACDIIFSICALVTRTFENIAYAYSLESRWSDRNNWYLKAHFFIYSLIFFTTQITSTFRVFPASCSSAAELSRCSKRGKSEWCLKAMNLQCLLFPPLTSPRHSGFSQLLSALKQLILKLKTWGAASDNDHLTIICWHFQKKCFFWLTPHKTVHVDMSRLSDYLDIPGFHSLAEFSRCSKRGKLQLNDVWKLRVYRVYFFPHSHHLDIPGFTSYPPPSSWYWSWKREVPQAIKWSFDNCLHFRNLFLLAPTS